jgi:hypothetical protein
VDDTVFSTYSATVGNFTAGVGSTLVTLLCPAIWNKAISWVERKAPDCASLCASKWKQQSAFKDSDNIVPCVFCAAERDAKHLDCHSSIAEPLG